MGKLKNSLTNVELFIEKAKRYTDITELTSELLHLFIDRIVVGEKAERYSRTAEQCVWIYYRDIGILDDVTKETDISEPGVPLVVKAVGVLQQPVDHLRGRIEVEHGQLGGHRRPCGASVATATTKSSSG